MIINHNLGAMNALSALSQNSSALNSALEKLSTGKKVNSAADNASGYAISQKMQAQINGLDQASQNAQDGISMIQTASGALNETTSILQNMRQLATQASNSTTTQADRQDLQTQFNQLASQINNIGNTTQFNTQNLLNGGINQHSNTVTANASTASVTASGATTNAKIGDLKLVVNNQTFDLSGTQLQGGSANSAADIATLGNVTSGSTKLSDVVNITADANGALTFQTKSTGSSSTIAFAGSEANASGTGAADAALGLGDKVTAAVDSSTLTASSVTAANAIDTTTAVGSVTLNIAGKSFDLSTVSGGKLTGTAATDQTNLGNILASDGVTKLSDLVDVTESGSKILTFTAKQAGTANQITFGSAGSTTNDATDTGLGFTGSDVVTVGADQVTAQASKVQAGSSTTAGTIGDLQLKVGATSFDLTGTALLGGAANSAADVATLGALTSGGTTLSSLVDITADASGQLTFTSKTAGTANAITFAGTEESTSTKDATDAVLGLGVNSATNGVNATSQQAGLQASTALSTSNVSIANNASFKIAFGTSSAAPVTINLNTAGQALNFNTTLASAGNADAQSSAMDDVVKTVNAALQQAGVGNQVQAALSTDNKLQLVSSTGENIYLTDGTGSPLSALGFSSSDETTNKNIQQDIGPGAQGTGFTATFQIGANTGQTMSLSIGDMRAAALGISGNVGQQGYSSTNNVTDGTNSVNSEAALDITSTDSADKAIKVIDSAIQTVTTEQANLGAVQNRLQSTINNLSTSQQNLTTAQSGITDVDMASEMSKFTQANVLQQAAVSMLAQANQQPQMVLKLLG